MLSFHAVYSLGGIVGASLAWVGAHWHLALWVSYLPVVGVLLPAALVGSRWYVDGVDGVGEGGAAGLSMRAVRGVAVRVSSSSFCCRCVW